MEQPLNQLETHQNVTSNNSINDESINLSECELILNELVDIVCEEGATLADIKRQCELTLNELVDRVLVECESAKDIQTNISISSSIHRKTGILEKIINLNQRLFIDRTWPKSVENYSVFSDKL